MSIIISCVGLRINAELKQISQRELEMLDNNREAVFSVHYDIAPDTGRHVYTIYSTGGMIRGAYLQAITFFEININDKKYGEKKYIMYFSGCNHYKNNSTLAEFDNKTQTFYFETDYTDEINKFGDRLKETLRDRLATESVYVYRKDRVQISYTDFENKRRNKLYQIAYGTMMAENEESIKGNPLAVFAKNYDDSELSFAVEQIATDLGV